MSAKQGGSITTLLLTIPLAAIPLLAIFGIPEFAHVTASEERPEPDIFRAPLPGGRGGAVVTSSGDDLPRSADVFVAPHDDAALDSQTAQARLPSTSTGGDAPAWHSDGRSRQQTAPDALDQNRPLSESFNTSLALAGDGMQPSPGPPPAAAMRRPVETAIDKKPAGETSSGLTWRAAARKLEETGITDYRLERGHRADQFLFVCRFSPGSDRRIIRRFEAESTDPLVAVEDVLTQVNDWLQYRYAESRQWVR